MAYPRLLIRMRGVGLPDGIAVSPYIHLGKAADVPDAHHRYSEVPEKVDNLLRLVPATEDLTGKIYVPDKKIEKYVTHIYCG